MGHAGDIEHTYTVDKALSKDVIERMRDNYGKAAEKYLTTARKEGMTRDQVREEFHRQFLMMAGYGEKEINQLGNLSELAPEQIQDLIRKKSMGVGLNGNQQKIVPLFELTNYIVNGWEFVTQLPTNEAIIRLPHH